MSFKPGSIVRVVTQPQNQMVHLVGEVGYLDEVSDEHGGMGYLCTMRLDGSPGGSGWVPLDDLEAEGDPRGAACKAAIDASREKLRQEGLARGERHRLLITKVGRKHGLTYETAKAIYEEIACGVEP